MFVSERTCRDVLSAGHHREIFLDRTNRILIRPEGIYFARMTGRQDIFPLIIWLLAKALTENLKQKSFKFQLLPFCGFRG